MKPLSLNTVLPKRGASGQAGFTLIELMVALLVIGILVAIAVPAYTGSVQSSRRTDAKNALLDLAQREEKYFSQNNAYTQNMSNLYPGSSVTGNSMAVETGSSPYYSLTVTVTAPSSTTAAAFSATATPENGQANDSCGTYTINNFGVTGNTGGSGATNCW